MRYSITTFLCFIILFSGASLVSAEEITVRPFLIDTTMVPRESQVDTIVISNPNANRKAIAYATVNEISVDTEGEIKEFMPAVTSNRTTSVTSWISVSRGRIEIDPGSKVEIPLEIKIHPFAEPGEYHVLVGFVEASKRYQAEAIAMAGEAEGVIVKITVADEKVESMRISSMVVDRFVTDVDKQQVAITIENAGDTRSARSGEIVFYDSRGREIAAGIVNADQESVFPGESATFMATIPTDHDLGRVKANVNLSYGNKQQASLYDSTYFYMVPLPLLITAIALFALVLFIIILLLRRNIAQSSTVEEGGDVLMYVKDGHNPNPKDHDIDLSK